MAHSLFGMIRRAMVATLRLTSSRLTGWFRPHAVAAPDADPAAAGAAFVFTAAQRLGLLIACTVLVMLRLPKAWIHGRFMDEEGVIFLAYAWHRPAADALWRSFGGYLNIGANASTLLAERLVRADLLRLEVAPYLTMAIALLFQMLPAVLLLTGRGRWLASRWAVVGALLILAMAPKTEEIFFNVLHIQFHLALAVALVLALDVPFNRIARLGYLLILLVAPLCGPGAIILWPFFALRALVERDLRRLAQAAVFGAGIAMQMLLFFTPSPVRGEMLDPVTLADVMFLRLAAMPVAIWKPNRVGRWLHDAYLGGHPLWWLVGVAAVAYFGTLIMLALRDRRDAAIWLIVPGLAIAALSFGGGMINSASREWFSVGAGERYNFLPLVLISLGLVALARRAGERYARGCAILFGLTLVSGAISYAKPLKGLASGPVWGHEVALWRQDRDHPLASWPAEWSVDLSDRDRPCSAPLSPAAAADPSYCESHWLARVRRATAIARAKR